MELTGFFGTGAEEALRDAGMSIKRFTAGGWEINGEWDRAEELPEPDGNGVHKFFWKGSTVFYWDPVADGLFLSSEEAFQRFLDRLVKQAADQRQTAAEWESQLMRLLFNQAVAKSQLVRRMIHGWGLNNPYPRLFERIKYGEGFGCTSETCSHGSHGEFAYDARLKLLVDGKLRQVAIGDMKREGDWVLYALIRQSEETRFFVVEHPFHYHIHMYGVDAFKAFSLWRKSILVSVAEAEYQRERAAALAV